MSFKKIGIEKPLRLVFLGCGSITKKHSKTIHSIEKNAELSFASRDISKARTYVDSLKGNKAFGSYEEAIESSEIDVVMINTPPNSHYDLVKKSLNAGKHAIVEKPPFFDSQHFDELGKFADERGLRLLVAENYFYKPLRKKIASLLKQDMIGDPLFLNINATKTQKSKGDWREDAKITGFGSLFEGGIHWVNFLNNIGFSLNSVHGFVPKQKSNLERSIQLTAHSKEGTVLNLFYSWEVSTIFKGLRLSKIFGREGSITFETNGIFVFLRGRKIRIIFPGFSDISGFKGMFKDFIHCLRTGEEPAFDWKKAQRDLQVVEAAYRNN